MAFFRQNYLFTLQDILGMDQENRFKRFLTASTLRLYSILRFQSIVTVPALQSAMTTPQNAILQLKVN